MMDRLGGRDRFKARIIFVILAGYIAYQLQELSEIVPIILIDFAEEGSRAAGLFIAYVGTLQYQG